MTDRPGLSVQPWRKALIQPGEMKAPPGFRSITEQMYSQA